MAPVPHDASPQPLLMRLAAVEGFDLGVALRNVGTIRDFSRDPSRLLTD